MFCKTCGEVIPDDSQFCPECGKATTGVSDYTNLNTDSAASVVDTDATISSTYAYQEINDLTRFLKYCLLAYLTICAISAFSDFAQMRLLQDFNKGSHISESELVSNDTRQAWIGYAFLAVFIVTGIAFLRWIYAANRNVRALGATGLRFSPGWAVGCNFVPFLWLWKPYQAMKEIWKCSQDPTAWQSVSTPSLLRWWWFLWLCSVYLGQFSTRLSQSDDVQSLVYYSGFSAFVSLFEIPLSLVAISMVSRVHEMQWTWHERRGAVLS